MAGSNLRTLVFLCSGGGGNLRFVHEAFARGWLPGWQRIVVLADRQCGATEYARQQGLEWACLDFRQAAQSAALTTIQAYAPDAVVTTVHRILSKELVSAFAGRLLNLHYSLLPAFGGMIGAAPVEAAMKYGVCLGGATVHAVTEELDGGPPLVQIAMPVSRQESLDAVMDGEFRAGCMALLVALRALDCQAGLNWGGMVIELKGRQALLNPALPLPEAMADETFWASLK